MNLFLVSDSVISIRKNDQKIGVKLDKNNKFLKNLKKYCQNCQNFVFVCNDPTLYEDNDYSAKLIFNAFKKNRFNLQSLTVLDNRNTQDCQKILQNADLVYLQGGIIESQNEFLKTIDFAKNINTNATLIGKSAGAMHMCKTVYNYPERLEDINNQRWFKGLGYIDLILIPHFNKILGNDYVDPAIDILSNYYLPDSYKNTFYALPNGSYILQTPDQFTIYGEAYVINNGLVSLICKNKKTLSLTSLICGE